MREDTRISRVAVPALDEILGSRFDVLDDGFVRVIDYMGSDTSIVQAARVSYGAGTKTIREDESLVRYLMRNSHTSPFEMCEIKLHVRVPMDTWRQWIRHRTASVNEYSTRYSIAIDSMARTEPGSWRLQARSTRQGSEGYVPDDVGSILSKREEELQRTALSEYRERLSAGVAREQARKDLPLSTYTEAYWKIDLHNLFHFLHLRLDSHAQAEIRAYARVIANEIMVRWCPMAWTAFSEYVLEAMRLSSRETQVVRELVSGRTENACDLARDFGWLADGSSKARRSREGAEAEKKLRELGFTCPWKSGDEG